MENQINANNACVVKRFMTRKVTASLQIERLLLHLYTASFLPGVHTIHLPEVTWVVAGYNLPETAKKATPDILPIFISIVASDNAQ